MDARQVQEYFSRYAEGFDAIYSGRKLWPLRFIDRLLRQDMYQRLLLTLEGCGVVQGKTVLDIGCGSGRYAVALAERGAHVTGIDFAGPMLELARKNAHGARAEVPPVFLDGDFLHYAFAQSFDITLAMGFFDYTQDAAPFLRKARELSKERFIVTFPRLWTHRAALRKVRLALSACPVHFYRRPQVLRLLEASGFAVERIEPLANSFWVQARPE